MKSLEGIKRDNAIATIYEMGHPFFNPAGHSTAELVEMADRLTAPLYLDDPDAAEKVADWQAAEMAAGRWSDHVGC